MIRYNLLAKSKVNLGVYDLLGREIAKLVNEEQEAGEYEEIFDGSKLSSGVYLCRIIAGDFVNTIKMMLVK